LKILNAQKDQKNISNETPKAQFDYFKIYGLLSKKLTIPKTEIPFMLSTEMDSQYAKQTLFGSEQFSVGGYHSVRGFRENYITGDSGYYFRNKANLNIGSLISYFGKKSEGFIGKNLANLNKFSLELFYDYGYIKNKHIGNESSGRLTGTGVKTIFSSKYFNGSLTYSWATNQSRLITSTKKENKMIYFELSANCC
jgi:hemolysin activation/secretion protein